jgi:hypothetical protein
MVKKPLPAQPVVPANVQVPVIVFPLTVPTSVSMLPAGDWDCTAKLNLPVTLPSKLPPRVNDPVAVSPETKQGEGELKVKLETTSVPSPFTASDVPKANAGLFPLSVRVAVQFPLTLTGLAEELLFDPHPAIAKLTTSSRTTAKFFMGKSSSWEYEVAHNADVSSASCVGCAMYIAGN